MRGRTGQSIGVFMWMNPNLGSICRLRWIMKQGHVRERVIEKAQKRSLINAHNLADEL